MPGVYTVTEQSIDKYVPQEVHRVTVVAGQVSKVNFNNVLKRGNLRVIKSSEDNLVEGVSCHSLRHTFTTRMCEAGVNVKVIQDTLGHKDISTTLNIYTDVTKELRKSEFEGLDSYFKNEYNKVSV